MLYLFKKILVAFKKAFFVSLAKRKENLGTFTTDTSGQLDVLGHDGDTLSMDGAQVGIFKKSNQISLRCFLKSHDSARLKPQVSLEILSNFTNKSLEGQLADQELSRLLVATNFTKSHGTR